MKLQTITLTTFLMLLVACGTERPNPEDYLEQGAKTPATGTKTGAKTADAAKTTTPSTVTPAPGTAAPADANKPATTATTPPPAPAATPARTVPNAAELTAATTYYNATCAGCHQPLATSTKKGLTPARLITGKTAAAHVNLNVDVTKWPEKDVTSNDGVENESLVATAFVQVLK